MRNKIKPFTLNSQKLQLAIILITYVIFSLIFGFANRYKINTDGVAYLRLAEYIAQGDFQNSVTGYWAPLITWGMAPFLFLGLDGLTTARIVSALSGLGLIFSVWLLTVRFNLSNTVKFISLFIMVLFISYWSIRVISPDLLLAALLICYLYKVTDPNIFKQKKISFLCGVLGGFAYLAKHYALPFFFVHYPLMLILRVYNDRNNKTISFKKIIVPLVIGMTLFLVISLPWILLISSKYQNVTISTSGRAANSIMRPTNKCGRELHPSFTGLHRPKETYMLHTWEDPSEMDYQTWSPFESKELLIHQIKLFFNNISLIFQYFISNSFMLGVLSFFILPMAFVQNFFNYKNRYLYSWCMITLIIYCLGYILTFAGNDRYYYPIMIMSLVLSFHFFEELKDDFRLIELKATSYLGKYISFFLLVVFVVSYMSGPAGRLLMSNHNYKFNRNREIADRLNAINIPGPVAIIDSNRKAHEDLHIVYFLKKQLLGRPVSSHLKGITNELINAKANTLIVFDNSELVQNIKHDTRYIFLDHFKSGEIKGWDNEINVFIITKEKSS